MVVIYHDFSIVIGNDYFTGKFQIKEKKTIKRSEECLSAHFLFAFKGKKLGLKFGLEFDLR